MKNSKCLFILSFLLGLFSTVQLMAQYGVSEVVFVSGGHYGVKGNYVKCYSYNPSNKSLNIFDSIHGNFTNAALADNDYLYIDVDSFLYKYTTGSHQKVDSIVIPGINKMCITGNYLIISRWYPATANYIQVYNKNNFKLLYNDLIVKQACNGMVAIGTNVYVAESSGDSGRLAVLDLSAATPKLAKEINMDTSALNIQDVLSDGQFIYTFSYGYTPSFSTAPVRANAYQLSTGTYQYLPNHPACTNVIAGNPKNPTYKIYASVSNNLQSVEEFGFNTGKNNQNLTAISNKLYTNYAYDSVHDFTYMVSNDYVNNSHVYIVDNSGFNKFVDSFTVGVSTQAVAVNYKITAGIEKEINTARVISVYPNPASSLVNIKCTVSENAKITIMDLQGKIKMEMPLNAGTASINIASLASGIYILSVQDKDGVFNQKLIKE